MKNEVTSYQDLNEVLDLFVQEVQAILEDNFVGAYLQGSFAVGDFDEQSDVDWLVAVQNALSDVEVKLLQGMHGRLFDIDIKWAKHLEGSYFPVVVLGDHERTKEPLWYLDNGNRQLIWDAHDNELVVRWVTREHGITLAGVPPKELIPVVPADDLRVEVRATLQKWGHDVLAKPEQINNAWYQAFATLSYCRMLHTLETGTIESKPASTRWAKENLDAKWVGLIERAEANRPHGFESVHTAADPTDHQLTLTFIAEAITLSSERR